MLAAAVVALRRPAEDVANVEGSLAPSDGDENGGMGASPHRSGEDSLACAYARSWSPADDSGRPALYWAVRQHGVKKAAARGGVHPMAALVALGASVNASGGEGARGRTPLHHAAELGDVESVRALLDVGADPAARDGFRITPLEYAANKGHAAVVDALLSHGGPNVGIYGPSASASGQGNPSWNPLFRSIQHGHIGVLTRLLADPSVRPNEPCYGADLPLHYAVQRGRLDVVQAMLSSRPSASFPPVDSHLYLPFAQCSGALDVNAFDGVRKSALHYAVERRDMPIVKALVEGGANVNGSVRTSPTPLYGAIGSAGGGGGGGGGGPACAGGGCRLAVLSFLIAAGASVHHVGYMGVTPLHYAAERGDAGAVRVLVGAGACVAALDGQGRTALHVAAGRGHLAIVRDLLAAGGDVDASAPLPAAHDSTPEGVRPGWGVSNPTPLLHALGGVSSIPIDAVGVLIASGADVNRAERLSGRTALHFAAANNCVEAAQLLADAGADLATMAVGVQQRGGHTEMMRSGACGGASAIRIAIMGGHDAVARVLRAEGAAQE